MAPMPNTVIFSLTVKAPLPPKVLSHAGIRRLLDRLVYRPLLEFMEATVITIVPQDTGALREAMMELPIAARRLLDNFPNQKFYIQVGTPGVQYAGVVNLMPTGWLQHPKGGVSNIGRRGDPLHDPGALHDWFGTTVHRARGMARRLYSDFITSIAADIAKLPGIKDPRKAAHGLFRVSYTRI